MKIFLIAAGSIIAYLQLQLFGPKGNWQELQALQHLQREAQQELENLNQRNLTIGQSLTNIQTNASLIEEKARQDLGWIKPNETFIYIHRVSNENID